MGFSYWISLFSECFKLSGLRGVKACFRFMIGDLKLDEINSKSSVFEAGGFDV